MQADYKESDAPLRVHVFPVQHTFQPSETYSIGCQSEQYELQLYQAKAHYVETISDPLEKLGGLIIVSLLIFALVAKGIASGERRVVRTAEAEEYAAKCGADARIASAKLKLAMAEDVYDDE